MEPGTAAVVRRGRPGVIVVIAFIVEFVAIVALANQVVTKHLLNYVAGHSDRFTGHLVSAFTVYQWRIGAQAGDRANEPLAHICLNLVVLALTALLVLAICRGPVTFGRAFFGTWMAVIVSTLVGQVVFNVVSPPPYPPGFSQVSGPVFTGPNGFGFVAGLMLGLVTAIFAAIFAVATRRTVHLGPAYVGQQRGDEYAGVGWWDQTLAYPRADYPQEGDPAGYPQDYRQPYEQPRSGSYYGDSYDDRAGTDTSEPSGGDATQHMPAVPEDEQQQHAGDRGDQPTEAFAPDEGTQQFPRPPADEDVGQQPGQRER